MNLPMLVVHGVANRDKNAFKETVSQLQNRIGKERWELIPVYWGDLGAKTEGLFETLFDTSSAVRAAELVNDWSALASIVGSQGSQQDVRSEEARLELILEGAALESGGSTGVRSAPQIEALAQVLREELPKTQALQYIQQADMLIEIGRTLSPGFLTKLGKNGVKNCQNIDWISIPAVQSHDPDINRLYPRTVPI